MFHFTRVVCVTKVYACMLSPPTSPYQDLPNSSRCKVTACSHCNHESQLFKGNDLSGHHGWSRVCLYLTGTGSSWVLAPP